MDEQFWHRKWRDNEIGFHREDANPLLLHHLPALGLATDARLLLPLCGKTRDIGWLLAQGHEVVGSELSELAVEQLFEELGVKPEIADDGPLRRFDAERLTVFAGNFFDLDRHRLGTVDAVYDRAAIVALPEAMRERYAGHLIHLTHTAPQLVVTFEYDPSRLVGPPFAVPEAELRRHYGTAYRVACLGRHELKEGLRGVTPVTEAVWRLERR
ncbi:thiopurine S-methyltransferase [Starkeya koreensis]|uniref:Thiopurine S-methyltransferase n=1 Tax=Ancylobacter koreensis TaxID=266121 RepID=A0ABT0DQV0_9HYPH|nr:thiopurine S-methyltransferase [Ancylobacter koreensis]MCK0209658.1 thiopurine S-methyltransferase [Ancylobacter koreensis]